MIWIAMLWLWIGFSFIFWIVLAARQKGPGIRFFWPYLFLVLALFFLGYFTLSYYAPALAQKMGVFIPFLAPLLFLFYFIPIYFYATWYSRRVQPPTYPADALKSPERYTREELGGVSVTREAVKIAGFIFVLYLVLCFLINIAWYTTNH